MAPGPSGRDFMLHFEEIGDFFSVRNNTNINV
jgi:hypothetical protein